MKVVFVASECNPIAKVGGLADVVGSLPKALEKLGVKVKIILPKYGVINETKFQLELVKSNLEIFFDENLEKFSVYKTLLPASEVEVFLIDHQFFSNGVYLSPTATPKGLSEVKRFAFFSQAALEFLKSFEICDVLHLNDWHTALIPVLKEVKFADSNLSKVATVLTIHNLGEAYQGRARGQFLHALDLEPEPVNFLAKKFHQIKNLNFFASLNFLQSGVETANIINTVSPQYAAEIKTREFGGKLAPVLQKRSRDIYGILNGIDYEIFNPKTDPNLAANYDQQSWPEGKKINKKALEEKFGLESSDGILAGMVTRLDAQKGLDLVLSSLSELAQLGLRIAILGRGDEKIEKEFGLYCQNNPKKAACRFEFNPQLANLIYAGADLFLMPSRYEPCGLGQIIAQKYGTIPVVRDVGGLHDTVEDEVTGFKFSEFTPQAFLTTVSRAVDKFNNRQVWSKMVENAMSKDFSWDKSAVEYVKLYERAIKLKLKT